MAPRLFINPLSNVFNLSLFRLSIYASVAEFVLYLMRKMFAPSDRLQITGSQIRSAFEDGNDATVAKAFA